MRRTVLSNIAFSLIVGLVFFAAGGFRFDGLPVGEVVRAFPALAPVKPAVWIGLFAIVLPTLFAVLDQVLRRSSGLLKRD
ncbi:hypothetical protein [Caulobacter sp. FWC26]|uniref:hypothetical protein n=1 Tax=Caulobacter sp. FWC26 TaxID=69665 RepID=UPI000C156994|nr:hypothetical protein [Caulobacter sp. FWC26]AZS19188.1 hypothetical protein CSW63_00185 [Caulobacter sp. FWC26]